VKNGILLATALAGAFGFGAMPVMWAPNSTLSRKDTSPPPARGTGVRAQQRKSSKQKRINAARRRK